MEVKMKKSISNNVDIDSILSDIRAHKNSICPNCGEVLSYQANADLSKIFCVYCDKCRFSAKMTYK